MAAVSNGEAVPADQKTDRPPSRSSQKSQDSDADLDALLSDPQTEALQSARINELQAQHEKLQGRSNHTSNVQIGHSSLAHPLAEKEAMELVAAAPAALLLVSKSEFATCVDMERLVNEFSHRHEDVCCVGVEAEKATWLCGKLGVRVLPTVLGFVEGNERGRGTGFEGLQQGSEKKKGGWRGVEWWCLKWGLIASAAEVESESEDDDDSPEPKRKGLFSSSRRRDAGGDDDDDDWD